MDQAGRTEHMTWLAQRRRILEADLIARVLAFEHETGLRVTQVRTITVDNSKFGEVRPRWSIGGLSVACEV